MPETKTSILEFFEVKQCEEAMASEESQNGKGEYQIDEIICDQ